MIEKKLPHRLAILAAQNSKERHYWLDKLSGVKELTAFPPDFTTSADSGYNRKHFQYSFDKYVVSKLLKLSNGSEVRLQVILVTAVNILLYKYTGITDLLIGTPVYRSGKPEEKMNTMLPLRNTIDPALLFKDFLLQVKQCLTEANDNRNYPLNYLQRLNSEMFSEDVLSLFDVSVALENIQERTGLSDKKHGILFSFSKEAEEIVLDLYYDATRYKPDTIRRIACHLEQLLINALSDPAIKIAQIGILGEQEQKKLLFDFNDTKLDYPAQSKVYELIEAQVKRTPDAIALVVDDRNLNYSELNEKANQLARYIIKHHIPVTGALIGILLDRSEWMLISMLAVMKTGAAYVPLDPAYPQQRIKYIVDDANVKLLITNRQLSELLLSADPRNIFCLDEHEDKIALESKDNLELASRAKLAYIIYTSGSTGKPKGTCIEHGGIINLLYWAKKEFKHEHLQGVLASTSICFDLSVFELYLPLTVGGKVILADSLLHLPALAAKNSITLINTVPSVLKEFLKHFVIPSSVQVVNLGGEALKRSLATLLYDQYDCLVYNLYGPTETTVYSTFSLVGKGELRQPSIGKPISNTQVYILDKNLDLVPLGMAGELHIGGAGLALEYLNQPELTKNRFIENPFEKGTRLYKTGDLVRWCSDGNMAYIGRIDHQLKIRGFRIELGEIENCLLNHPQIKEAVVVAKQHAHNDEKYLVAYIVSANKEHGCFREIREYLKNQIPEYMIPGYFEQLTKLPLTSNGKIDRKALEISKTKVQTETPLEEAGDEIQHVLLKIWEKVFASDSKIGVSHNFFELGGHSLQAFSIINKIYRELNIEVPVSVFLKNPSVKELAAFIKQAKNNNYPAIEAIGKRKFYPVSPAQKRVFITQQFDREGIASNATLLLKVQGEIDREKLGFVLNQIIQRHESLRTSFELKESTIVQRVHKAVDFRINYKEGADRTIQDIVREFIQPFDLEKAPLFRACLVKRGEKEYLLMLDMHHIVCDGASWEIFMNEFEGLYKGEKLPEITIHYKDYAVWLDDLMSSEVMRKQEQYWLNQLKGDIPELKMPVDRLDAKDPPSVGSIQLTINKQMLDQLHILAAEKQATLFMVLFSLYNLLLHKYTGQHTILVGSPVSGRFHAAFQDVIGMFVNALALRSELRTHQTFEELLDETKQRILAAHENQLVQFDDLLNKLNVKRTGNRNLLYNTIFLFFHVGRPVRDIGDIILSRYENDSNLGLYDLLLEAVEASDEVKISIEYNAALFKKETIQRLGANYKSLCRQVIRNPKITAGEVALLGEYDSPGNALELRLLEFWSDALNMEKDLISINANFFELGGHSFKAMMILSAIQKEFQVRIPMALFFKIPTIKSIAEYISGAEKNATASIAPASPGEPYPVSSEQKRMFILNQFEESIKYNFPLVMKVEGNLDKDRLETVFGKLVDRHESLRTGIEISEQNLVQKIYPHVAFKIAYIAAASGKAEQLVKNFFRPFDLSKAPIFRVGLMEISASVHILMIDLHHIVADAITLEILIRDLSRLYRGEVLPPLPLQYKDYAVWQTSRFHSQRMKAQELYWLDQFKDPVPELNLPVDYPWPQIQSFEGDILEFKLNESMTTALNRLVKKNEATLFMILLGAYVTLLYSYTEQEDITVGSPVAGRTYPELQAIAGMFANTIVLRSKPNGQKPFSQLLKEVKKNALDAFDNQEFQFDELVEKLNIKRNLSRNPLFDTMLTLQNTGSVNLTMDDLKLSRYPLEQKTSIFAITLEFEETGDTINVCMQYCTKLFRKETMFMLKANLIKVLQAVTTDPGMKLDEIKDQLALTKKLTHLKV